MVKFSWIKKEPVLVISALAALISCCFVPPDREYLGYIDLRTIALLYALMIVVSGFRKAGVFTFLANALCAKAKSVRSIGIMLVSLCFFSSMLITNDVALLTFVPFSVIVLELTDRRKDLLLIIVLQTLAANLGSMLTPVGNPQNLYLYSFYEFSVTEFLASTFPVWLLSLVLLLACCFLLPKSEIFGFQGEKSNVQPKELWLYLVLFLVCLMTVLRVLPWYGMLVLVVVPLLFLDRSMLKKADFMLLLTFVAFFIFAGNLARIEAVSSFLRSMLSGKEYLTSLLTSQVISNVPAALLLSSFTENANGLLLGVNVGGLGTPIASLASLISLKLYAKTENAAVGRFLGVFTLTNLALLILLSIASLFLL